MAKRSHLPPDIKKRALRYYDQTPGYCVRFEEALTNAKASPQVFELLGQKMVKIVFNAGTHRKGHILILSDGSIIETERSNFRDMTYYNPANTYYNPANEKFYGEFLNEIPATVNGKIAKLVLEDRIGSFADIVGTLSTKIVRDIPENITEQIISAFALEKTPEWFNTPVKHFISLKEQPWRSSSELGMLVANAFNHWANINKDNVYALDFNDETVFSMVRKYLTYKKLEGMNS